MTTPTGRFVWFDYVSNDATTARAFFGALFGWTSRKSGNSITIVAGGRDIAGYIAPVHGGPSHTHWLAQLQVASAHETAGKVKTLGGKVLREPVRIDTGLVAIASDPNGSVFALTQPTNPGDGTWFGEVGTWCWNELATGSPVSAVAFYKQIGGFTEKKLTTPTGTYHLLERDGQGRAGIMKATTLPAGWIPYVQVANTDDAVARAQQVGAQPVVAPADAAGVGRYAVIINPQNVPIGLLQPA